MQIDVDKYFRMSNCCRVAWHYMLPICHIDSCPSATSTSKSHSSAQWQHKKCVISLTPSAISTRPERDTFKNRLRAVLPPRPVDVGASERAPIAHQLNEQVKGASTGPLLQRQNRAQQINLEAEHAKLVLTKKSLDNNTRQLSTAKRERTRSGRMLECLIWLNG